MSIGRKRLSPEASRTAALEAARDLLLEAGPQAVTLKAVAGRIGRTHANLLHHFGSAAGLQTALATSITESICTEIAKRIQKARSGEAKAREIVDLAFDAFDKHGAGALTSWMILSGNEAMLEPIVETIHRMVDEIAVDAHEDRALHDDTLTLVLLALGDALMGEAMARSLGLPRTRARDIAERLMMASIEVSEAPQG
ncbi:MAG TPA: TetR family transcriptional regulator [Chakrabartia sp.]|jgi:AcrR family transcriptional regulator|nr:TetR family transcriptional regulator [Chakrabartia sp.]